MTGKPHEPLYIPALTDEPKDAGLTLASARIMIDLTGVFAGPICGLRYKTPTHEGYTNERGEFAFRNGERVAFFIGEMAIGMAKGASRINLAQVLGRVDGDLAKLKDPGVTNLARFIYSISRSSGLRDEISIAPEVHAALGNRRVNFYSDINFGNPAGFDPLNAFAPQEVLVELLQDLNKTKDLFDQSSIPRQLISPASARNTLRRQILGIRRFRDVKIPLRNGSYLLADVFRPAGDGSYPVIMNCGVYGKAFDHYSIGNDDELESHEQLEDDYFFGNSKGQVYENHETVNTAVWVPKGYCVVRVDGPGVGNNPGEIAVWGIDTARAFYDAIEWAGVQSWCNGNVGTWGMSYYAVTQHAVASLQPPHLKAMITIGTDIDLYEEIAYTGGLYNTGFFPFWYHKTIAPAVCGKATGSEFLGILPSLLFKNSDHSLAFGPESKYFMKPDMSKIDVPLWCVGIANHQFNFHQLGSSEAFIHTPTRHKKFDIWEDWWTKSYSASSVADHMKFFDHWLKGIENGIMEQSPVRLEIRTGDGASYMHQTDNWPVQDTQYPRWFLNCAKQSELSTHLPRDTMYCVDDREPVVAGQASYSADTQSEGTIADRRTTGVAFVSGPMTRDMVLAGYGKLKVWVSSSSNDMDIYVSVRVLDERGNEVDYTGPTTMAFPARIKPVMKGWLKVSHRMIDTTRSTEYTVKHTHLKADAQPLSPDEIVPVEIELSPNTALVRRGHRIVVEVQPHDGWAHGVTPHEYNEEYHKGATNRVHTGPDRVGFVQLPMIG